MVVRQSRKSRRGAIVPLAAISLVGLLGLIALAIDLSLVVVGRTQCQSAADIAAMAACRQLDGDLTTNNNISAALATGNTSATTSSILGESIPSANASVKIGVLLYDKTQSPPKFVVTDLTTSAGPPPSTHNWGAAEVTVSGAADLHFAKLFGMSSLPVNATAQAIHRPRDVGIIMDFSGSMMYDSFLAGPYSSYTSNSRPYRSLNNDPRVPKFGHYDPDTYDAYTSNPGTAAMLVNSETPSAYDGDYVLPSNEILRIGNQTYTTDAGNPIVEDFYTLSGSSMVKAFIGSGTSTTPVTNYDSHNFPTTVPNYSGTSPGGIRPLRVNTTETNLLDPSSYTFSYTADSDYAKNIDEILNMEIDSSNPNQTVTACPQIRRDEWEGSGVVGTNSGNSFYNTNIGYTYGPGYWGKTFFVWPPNPDDTPNLPDPTTSTWSNHNNSSDGGPIRDWRQRFYWKVNNSTGVRYRLDDNNVLYTSQGRMRPPSQSNKYTDPDGNTWEYEINYRAVLWWLKNEGPSPLPDNVRSGRILYYDSIPDHVDNASTDADQQFWKEYIDYVFGWTAYSTSGSGSTQYANLESGFGSDFYWNGGEASNAIYTKPGDEHIIGRVEYSSGYSSGHGPDADIRVKMPSGVSPYDEMLWEVPKVGEKIKFSNHSTIYTIKSVDTNNSQWRIRLVEPLTNNIYRNNNITLFRAGGYMDYRDNPHRPKMRWWFGPLSFVDFLFCDYDTTERSWRPGNCHEAPLWVLKAGIQSALADIQKNHPNDWVSLQYFSVPRNSSTNTNVSRRFNRVRGPLGKNYEYMSNALWYPPSVIQNDGSLVPRTSTSPPGEIRPWTTSFTISDDYRETPKAMGGTCPSWGFQLAYNQFSSNSTLLTYDTGQQVGMAGGNGRLGARKMVVFETDGVPNHKSSIGFQNNGAGQSYWKCRQPNEWPSVSSLGNMNSGALNACYEAVRILCDNKTGTRSGTTSWYYAGGSSSTKNNASGSPGYADTNKPVLVHSLAFGGLFESSSSLRPDCLRFLQSVQTIGSTQTNASTALPSYKVITGTSTERIDKIRTAFTIMMQDGVQITLFK